MTYEVKSLNEECGVFGIWGHPDAAKLTYFGLHSLQHRGQEGAGILANDQGTLRRHRDTGLLSEVFRNPLNLEKLTGITVPYKISFSLDRKSTRLNSSHT